MRPRSWLTIALALGAFLAHAGTPLAQTTTISDADCAKLRQSLADHARLSDGVRRSIAARTGAAPAAATPAPAPAPAPASSRADAIKARLEQIPKDHQALEEQRLGAMMRFDLSRAAQIQGQLQALDAEKAALEREQAALPPAAGGTPSSTPAAPADPTARLRCQDLPAAVSDALKTRRRELGAREDQAGAIPLVALTGQTPDQIGQALAAQFAPGPAASTQVGLLDSDGKGRLDGIVDVPAAGSFRLVRQRGDGSLSFEVFPASPGGTAPAYGDVTRRLDETAARQNGQTLADLLATRPATPPRVTTQTADFAAAYAQFEAGNFAEAARLGPAARSTEFQNAAGGTVRVLEVVTSIQGGVSLRRAVVLALPNDQEAWEETTTLVRPVSYWKTDVELARARQTRTTAGAVVGTAPAPASSTFSLER